jgi:uncharacterized delta-60 repeat protein
MKWMAVLALVLCAGCGGGDNSGGGSPPPPPPPSGIGAAGGTVTEASGAQVVIPAGALAANTNIAITQSSAGAPPVPADITAIGPIYAFTPHGTTFASPVTITVPFDASQVPAGRTPVLYKTDATRTSWAEVPGATLSGATMTAEVTSFSNLFAGLPPTQLISVRKDWTLATGQDSVSSLSVLARSDDDGDFGAVDAVAEFGRQLTFEDFRGAATVFSTQDGAHYYLAAAAPAPDDTDPPDMHEGYADISLGYTFRKNAADATLKFTLSAVQLDTIHPRGVGASVGLCPWVDENIPPDEIARLCENFLINPAVGFALAAWSENLDRIFYSVGGEAGIAGVGRAWNFTTHDVSVADLLPTAAGIHIDPETADSEVFDRVWTNGNFDFTGDLGHDGGAQGHAVLHGPITITVPLADVPVDSVFTVESVAAVRADNHVQGESEAFAYLRDPVDTGGGVTIEFTGLELLPSQSIPATHKALHPCAGAADPAAGIVQFHAPDFATVERQPARGFVEIERVDGSAGEIGVRLDTADDSAHAGSDYAAAHRVVWFHDGQDGVRTVAVPILLDAVEESAETAHLALTVVSGCASLSGQSTATLTIFDDDQPVVVTPKFTIGGTVTGLEGSGLTLRSHFNDLHVAANGPFTFSEGLDDGTSYSVTIATQPTNPAQICTVTNGSGTLDGADVTNVAVDCVTPPPVSGLDPSFGAEGKVFTALGNVNALAQQADGKLLALANLALARFNADGTPDASFGTGGQVSIDTGGSALDTMHALVVQPDGKVIVVGHTSLATVPNDNWVVFRFDVDGSPDGGFGTAGRVETDFEGLFDDATAVMLDSTGRIVVAGFAQIHKTIDVGGNDVQITDQDFAVVRYLPDGTPDPTYGVDGKATLGIDGIGNIDYLNAAALQDDGSVVAVGRSHVDGASNADIAVARFLDDGTADPAFGTFGSERIDVATGVVPDDFRQGLTDEALDVALSSDGRIFLAGYSLDELTNSHPVLMRLASTGALEASFAPAIPAAITRVNALALDGNRIVIAGPAGGDFGIARFTADGAVDPNFGTGGLLTADFFGGTDVAFDVLLQSDGRIVAGGSARNGASGGAGLVRVTP